MTRKELTERILLKITSSKFWAFLAVFVVSVMTIFGADATSETQTTAMIVAFGDLVVYTFANVAQKYILNDEGEEAEEDTDE